jgi:glycosyltransferase involved in cell wall biosynthesis
LKTKVCHISTVHPLSDIRILEKECQALNKAGYEVSFIVSHKKDEEIRGIKILALPRFKTRFSRVVKNGFLAFRNALRTKAEVYHFHDPELILTGLLLSLHGKKVIYDVHEDVPKAILNKEWVPPFLRKTFSSTFERIENWAARRMSLVITATPTIRNRFLSVGCHAVDVNNYPLLSEFQNLEVDWKQKGRAVCYVGSIDRYRGIVEMTQAIGKIDGKLLLAGTFSPASNKNLVNPLDGWKKIVELGEIDRKEVRRVFATSRAGLVLYHPQPNHLNAQPNKMFEYMSAGLPVIASNFPLWREIIEENNCGLCCDPLNSEESARAIQWIFDHPEEARLMGEKGQKAVRDKYNWESESKKLLALYEELLQ